MSLYRLAQLRELSFVQALLDLHEGRSLLVADMIVQQLAELARQSRACVTYRTGLRHAHRELSDLGVLLPNAGDDVEEG